MCAVSLGSGKQLPASKFVAALNGCFVAIMATPTAAHKPLKLIVDKMPFL